MTRRTFLAVVGAWMFAAMSSAFPQNLRRIGVLLPGTRASYQEYLDAFLAGMKELGHAENRDFALEIRFADGKTEQLSRLAAELVALQPDVMLTATSAAVAACKKATSSIPVVFATAFSPVEQGFVSSLQRPGGNITGVIVFADLTPKMIEIAREALPGARRLAILLHEIDQAHRFALETFEPTARRLNFEPIVVRIARAADLERAFMAMAEQKADAVIIPALSLFTTSRRELGEHALKTRLPILSANNLITEAGGLMSYGTLQQENYRRAASLVDKVLRGAKPAELPVQQPERFHLTVNRKTARTIGVALSPVTMLRADRFID